MAVSTIPGSRVRGAAPGRGSARGRSACRHRATEAGCAVGNGKQVLRPACAGHPSPIANRMPDGALARPRVFRGGAKRPWRMHVRVFPSSILSETEVVPVVWTADRQIEGVLSNSARLPMAGGWRRSGGTDGPSPPRPPLCCLGLCRAPGPSGRPGPESDRQKTSRRTCRRRWPAAGPGPAFPNRPARAARILAARRMIPPAGRKAGLSGRSRGVSSGQCVAAASPFGELLDGATEVLPPTAATRLAAVSLGSSYPRRHRCEHCLCLFATANLVNLRLRRQWALGATGEPAA